MKATLVVALAAVASAQPLYGAAVRAAAPLTTGLTTGMTTGFTGSWGLPYSPLTTGTWGSNWSAPRTVAAPVATTAAPLYTAAAPVATTTAAPVARAAATALPST